jgi:cytochrome c oxidase assembly protein subunit 11
MTSAPSTMPSGKRPSGVTTALICGAVVVGMVGLSFAAVPLYRIFCQATGFGGTTQRAEKAADHVLDRKVTVRFDANIGNGLGWRFRPITREVTLRIGETGEALFSAQNMMDTSETGTAAFNVTPEQAGAYFTKIACFCFTEQTLKPGEEVRMPVLYYVDPDMLNDPNAKDVPEITLSYTFLEAADSATATPQNQGAKPLDRAARPR